MTRNAFVIFAIGLSLPALAAPWKVDAIKDLRARYGLAEFDKIDGFGERLQRIKVAVIDNGFGDPATLGRELPAAIFKDVLQFPAEFLLRHPRLGPVDRVVLADDKDKHGREMATIAWATTGGSRSDAPQFYLVNGKGLFNLERAVQYCIDEKVDIILYAQNWEYGGNFDGRGFINAIVTRATDAKILWVNAGGNYGGRTFNAPVKFEAGKTASGEETWLDLNGKKELRLQSRLDDNGVRIVLSWNRNSEDRKAGTDADLDLFLYDEYGSVVSSSEQRQVFGGADKVLNEEKRETDLAREIISAPLSRNKGGYYTLRVKARAGRFNSLDKLRITVIPNRAPFFEGKERKLVDAVEFLDATKEREVMVPADHPDVLAVGDFSALSSKGPTMDGRIKPDFHLVSSQIEFSNGESSAGTSNAAAMFAGIAATLKAFRPSITREEILKFVQLRKPSQAIRGEARGVQDLGLDHVRERHPVVFGDIERRIKDGTGPNSSPILLAGRFRREGTYVIALDRSPAALNAWWRNIPRDARDVEFYDIYLRAEVLERGGSEAWAYVRPRQRAEGDARKPWEKEIDEKPEQFVQVIQARRIEKDDKEKAVPMWATPTPAELRALATPTR